VASGPGQPPAGPPRLADRLARHRWVAAAGMTAAIAVVAGGGLALALHDSSPGPPKECGLVPCAAALPASVQSSGDETASGPAAAAPTAAQRATTPPGPAHSATPPAASAPAPGTAPPEAAPPEAAPPADRPAAAGPAADRPAAAEPPADRPAAAEPVSIPEPRGSCTTVVAFTAGGTLSTPVRCTFTDAVRQQRTRGGSGHPGSWAAGQDGDHAGGQLRPGRSSHHGWQASWLSDWLSRGRSRSGWPGSGWSGGGWSGSGRPGQRGGWPGGR
jgi:translation initiation factor IF-2